MGRDDDRRPGTELTTTHVDETILEPARRGLRKFGAGMGKVASGALVALGISGSAFGGILMALASGFFAGVGAFFLAGGVTAIGVGAIGLLAVNRADSKADGREVERRLLKIVRAEKRVTDEVAARRIAVDVAVVRATAERLFREGVLDIDIDPESGADVYTLERQAQLETSLPPEDAAAMRGFDERLGAAVVERAGVERQVEAVGRDR